jgi:hypothetical protein
MNLMLAPRGGIRGWERREMKSKITTRQRFNNASSFSNFDYLNTSNFVLDRFAVHLREFF